MTKITRKTVRETGTDYKGEKLVVELFPRTVRIWRKGTSGESLFVSYDAIYELGLKLAPRRKA